MGGDMQMEEKSRTCPSCRTSISVLATKCRFCGETVGKPKVEVRQLSVNDLGGESVRHQAVSSNVIAALDEMRKEAGAEGDPETQEAGDPGIDLSSLDDFDKPSFNAHTPKPRQVSIADRLTTAVKIIVVLGIIAFLATKVSTIFKPDDGGGLPTTNTSHKNLAPGILADNGDLMDALAAAVIAVEEAPEPANKKIRDEVMALLTEEIDGLLNANPWTIAKLREASSRANKAAEVYPSDQSNDLMSKVSQESIDYGTILLGMDPAAGTATFQLNTGSSEKKTVRIGELVAGRFKVTSIQSDKVRVQDIKRNNRNLASEMAQGPR